MFGLDGRRRLSALNLPEGGLLRRRKQPRFPMCCFDQMAMGEFGEDRWELMSWVDIDAEFVVAAAEVLDERVPGTDHSGRARAVSVRASAVTWP